MKQRRIILGVAIFFTISLIFYAFLGGLKKVMLSKANNNIYHMVGVFYEGSMDSKDLKESFLKAKSLIEEGMQDGTLAILYYKDATSSNDIIQCFTGILVEKEPSELPKDMEFRTIESNGVIKARFEGHRLVTPSPADIKDKVKKYAAEENLQLQPLFVEKYFSNNAIEVDYLLQ